MVDIGIDTPEGLDFHLWRWSEDLAWRMIECNSLIAVDNGRFGTGTVDFGDLFTGENKLACHGSPLKRIGMFHF